MFSTMWSRFTKFFLIFFLLISPVFAQTDYGEQIMGFNEDDDLPILNERLRQIENRLFQVKSASGDSEPRYLDDAIPDLTLPGLRGWSTDILFSATDNDTVEWTSGDIVLSDASSTTYNITSGNTGTMSALTYIYFDADTSTTALQTSSSVLDSVGGNKILVAVSENVADATKYATYQVFGGQGGFGGTWVAANNITTGTITANEIAASTITAGLLNVTELSAITADIGTITAGSMSGVSVTAESGTIGGWDLGTNTLESTNDKIKLDSSSESISVGDIGGTYINIDGANNKIETSDYSSGALGSGWHIGTDTAEFANIRARGKFSTSVFEKDTISSVGGNFLVSDSDILDSDMASDDTATLTISGDTTFATGDFLRIKDGNDDEWFEITDDASAPTYTVTRDKAGDYGADSNPNWKKGTAVVNYGASGEGLVYMTASDTNAPYLNVLTHAGAPWTTTTTRVRLGNLNGFLGYSSDLYGIAIGEASEYLKYDPTNGLQVKGTVSIESGSSGYDNLSDKLTDAEVRSQTGWSHGTDATKIDGGDIYTNTITATQISVSQLDAVSTNTGTLTVDEYIQSSDYSSGTAGFKLDHQDGLEINEGTIKVGAMDFNVYTREEFTSNDTWTCPSGVDEVYLTMVGAGGGGGGSNNNMRSGSGGGGGAGYYKAPISVSAGSNYSITIGSGGSGATGHGDGGNGGSTSFGSYTVSGGSGGLADALSSPDGGAGGSVSQGSFESIGFQHVGATNGSNCDSTCDELGEECVFTPQDIAEDCSYTTDGTDTCICTDGAGYNLNASNGNDGGAGGPQGLPGGIPGGDGGDAQNHGSANVAVGGGGGGTLLGDGADGDSGNGDNATANTGAGGAGGGAGLSNGGDGADGKVILEYFL